MNTAPLQNPASILASPQPAARQNGAASSATSFNQLLSQEVAQRRDAAHAKGADSQAPKTDSGKAPAADAAPGPDKDLKPTADSSVEETESATPASAELLALVAGLQRGPGHGAADSADAAVDATDTAEDPVLADKKAAVPGTGIPIRGAAAATVQGRLPAAADGKIELPAALAGTGSARDPAHDAAKEAALKPEPAFAAALKQAADAKPALDAIQSKAADAAPAIAPLAPGVAQLAQNLAAPATDKLTPQVGTPAWDSALGQKVVWMVAGGQQSASLTLNPPDLGPLQVVLHVSNSHANATFVSAQPEVRQALEAAMPRLREMMNDAGIQLGQANVGAGMPDQQQAAAEQSARHAARRREQPSGEADATLRPVRATASAVGRGLVDTFA